MRVFSKKSTTHCWADELPDAARDDRIIIKKEYPNLFFHCPEPSDVLFSGVSCPDLPAVLRTLLLLEITKTRKVVLLREQEMASDTI